jgi:hypothetical protein
MNIARVAYEAYKIHTGGKTFDDGRDMPAYESLSNKIQAAWLAAAEAVIRTVKSTEGDEYDDCEYDDWGSKTDDKNYVLKKFISGHTEPEPSEIQFAKQVPCAGSTHLRISPNTDGDRPSYSRGL